MTQSVAVIDYGMGNLHSVASALKHVGAGEVIVSHEPDAIAAASRVVFPGVGGIRDCMTTSAPIGDGKHNDLLHDVTVGIERQRRQLQADLSKVTSLRVSALCVLILVSTCSLLCLISLWSTRVKSIYIYGRGHGHVHVHVHVHVHATSCPTSSGMSVGKPMHYNVHPKS